MKHLAILPFLFACLAAPVQAASRVPDFSGTYECNGDDGHEGPYTATATLRLVKAHSRGEHRAYSFKLEVPGGAYPGHGVARGREMAIYFANLDPAFKDYGTGLARFWRNKAGKWVFSKYYYQPEYKGGNHGTETCVQR